MRRLVGVLAGVALAAGTALVPMFPAAAGPGLPATAIEVDLLCDPTVGQFYWATTISTTTPEVAITVAKFLQTPPGTDLKSAFSPNPFSSVQPTTMITTLPGNTPSFTVSMVLTSTGGSQSAESDFPIATPCAKTADLQVEPTTVSAGSSATISGTGCLAPHGSGPGGSGPLLPGTVNGTVAFNPSVAFGPITAAADGSWSTQVVVPPGTVAGSYAVNATCSYPGLGGGSLSGQAVTSTSFDYQERNVVVPVVVTPKFTG
ncbi:MAG TPA: hypothetical protein VFW06_08845 [Acidimicrobiia bacterium]|nr:hypothetical protein [Acidimicrobiia bacterium]